MPTPPLEPVEDTKTESEKLRRIGAMALINAIFISLHDMVYGHRSDLPNGEDCTDFMGKLNDVHAVFKNRPDWTANIVEHALRMYGPERSTQIDIEAMREVITKFEEWSGLKLNEKYPHQNQDMAKAVKIITDRGGPKQAISASREEISRAIDKIGRTRDALVQLRDLVNT